MSELERSSTHERNGEHVRSTIAVATSALQVHLFPQPPVPAGMALQGPSLPAGP
jgi:hypothetical protein